MNGIIRNGVVAACCSVIGGILAFNFGLLWFVGVLIGGLAGWIGQDLAGLWRGVTAVWEQRDSDEARKKRKFAKWYVYMWVNYSLAVLTFILVLCAIIVLLPDSVVTRDGSARAPNPRPHTWSIFLLFGAIPLVAGSVFALIETVSLDYSWKRHVEKLEGEYHPKTWSTTNPLVNLFVRLPHYLFWKMWVSAWNMRQEIVASVVGGIRGITSFFWEVFLRVNCQPRVVCSADTMLGALIGYLSGSILVCMVAGFVIGVAHAWVAKHWVAPLRSTASSA